MPELMMGPFEEGLAQAGRPRDAFDVAPMVPLAVAEDRAAAREKVRPIIAFYLGGMGHASKNFYVEAAERYGHGESARAVQERFLAGDRAGAGAALSDELIDAVSIATDARGLDERLAAYERAGADTVLAIPCGEREDKLRAARAFAAALG
jgi:alkanesulfonate monooxygenase SsuD/methylene tetrahydromethanopterin reductase-like flavin-dependent oxidoreductase (luciferase family)